MPYNPRGGTSQEVGRSYCNSMLNTVTFLDILVSLLNCIQCAESSSDVV